MRFNMNLERNNWQHKTNPPSLKNGEVHIWKAFIDRENTYLELLSKTLSEDEKYKAESFCFEKDRNQFIVSRGILRKLIGSYLGISPTDIGFSYNRFGKPMLIDSINQKLLRFNISHSNKTILFAFTLEQEIGVDIEFISSEFATLKVAEQFCSSEEILYLNSLNKSKQISTFYNFWTQKEAYIKGIGKGLSSSLKQITLPAISEQWKTRSNSNVRFSYNDWTIVSLPTDAEYSAALAINGSISKIRFCHYLESYRSQHLARC